jgi:flagellar FliL protein
MSDAKDAKKPEKKDGAAAGEHGDAPKKAGGSKLLPMMVGVNSLLLVAVVGFMAMQMMKANRPPPAEGEAEAASEKKEGGEEKEKKKEGGEKKEGEKKKEGGEKKEGEKKEGGEKKSEAGGAMGPLVKIPDFVIHLRNPEVDRYARMSFDVEVYGEGDKDRVNESLPKIRDAFITYLSDRTLEDLRGAEGLGRTKDALQTKLRELVPDARIRALYISDFVVQ